jgi:hypothetical protein
MCPACPSIGIAASLSIRLLVVSHPPHSLSDVAERMVSTCSRSRVILGKDDCGVLRLECRLGTIAKSATTLCKEEDMLEIAVDIHVLDC